MKLSDFISQQRQTELADKLQGLGKTLAHSSVAIAEAKAKPVKTAAADPSQDKMEQAALDLVADQAAVHHKIHQHD